MFGETRFIFSLVNIVTVPTGEVGVSQPLGAPPFNFDGFNTLGSTADWRGMNVILEYGNPFTDACGLKDWAQQWLDLSAYTISDDKLNVNTTYNQALEALTHTVIDAGQGGSKPNGSALNRIRTNERIFEHAASSFQNAGTWPNDEWELSQFELDAQSHLLTPATVTNTPVLTANTITNTQGGANNSVTNSMTSNHINATTINPNEARTLIDWVFAHDIEIMFDNHDLPASYSYNGVNLLKSGTARVNQKQEHFWDLLWTAASTDNYTTIAANDPNEHAWERKVRQHLSLNTCQGCHSGENKTIFTQVKPVGYGESLDYWSTYPAYDYDTIDTRFANNTGQSHFNNTTTDNYPLVSGVTPTTISRLTRVTAFLHNDLTAGYFQRVSPFLTGRNYLGNTYWDDDHYTDPYDNVLNGLFFVYDPADHWVDNPATGQPHDQTKPKKDNVNGYNDLERRKLDLCKFINFGCNNSSTVLGILDAVSQIPTGND